jgi:hypothetical protein
MLKFVPIELGLALKVGHALAIQKNPSRHKEWSNSLKENFKNKSTCYLKI